MKHRVGGKDTVHIFHLPNGSSLLEADDSERAPPKRKGVALSKLFKLDSGAQIGSFPEYQ